MAVILSHQVEEQASKIFLVQSIFHGLSQCPHYLNQVYSVSLPEGVCTSTHSIPSLITNNAFSKSLQARLSKNGILFEPMQEKGS